MRTRIIFFFIIGLIAVVVYSCDIYRPQESYTFAVSKNDYLYGLMYSHLKPFMEQNGYKVNVIYTDRVVDANRLVAEGKADLTFVNNTSSHIVEAPRTIRATPDDPAAHASYTACFQPGAHSLVRI